MAVQIPAKHLKEINTLKGFSVLAIVIFHYANHFNAQPFDNILAPIYSTGLLFVDLLLIISGFLLTRSYLNSNRARNLITNLVYRILRFYPLHIFTLISVAILQYIYQIQNPHHYFIYRYNDGYHFLLNLLMIHFIGLQKGFSFNGPSWFLSALLFSNSLFYLIISIFKKHLYKIFFLIMTLSSLLSLKLYGIMVTPTLLRSLAMFFLGCIIFYIHQNIQKNFNQTKKTAFDVGFLISSLIILKFLSQLPAVISTFNNIILLFIAFPLFIITLLNSKYISILFKANILQYLAKISFSIFLIHFPLQLICVVLSKQGIITINYSSSFFFLLFFFILFILSSLSYQYIELPFLKYFKNKNY